MRIFLTGATGFIGRHVAETLRGKNELLALTRSGAVNTLELNTITGALSDLDSVKGEIKRFKPDAIVHMAWEGIPDYSYAMSVKNLRYGLDVLELCKYVECGTILFTGSCWEYKAPQGRIYENHELSNGNGFKAAKNALHAMAEAFCAENGISLHWTRLFYVYGPGQKKTSIIPYAIKSLKEGKFPDLRTPHNKNDFVYVKTVSRTIEEILKQKPRHSTINIGSGKSIAIIDVLKIISGLLGVFIDFSAYPCPTGNETDFFADTSIMEELGIMDCAIGQGIEDMFL